MSYRLESPRPRSPLPPLRIRSTGYAPSTVISPTTLLYDLPQSSSQRSPSLQSPEALLYSPTLKSPPPPDSPTHALHRARHTPPPRAHSATPAQAARHELDQFAAQCRAWYFDQDERAGQQMTQTLESLGASQRAPFSRIQANIRSAYHANTARRRKTEFRAHLSSTHPGGSLSPSARVNPTSKAAKKERYDRFSRFLRTWCTTSMPGPRPFIQALWAVMRLQVLPEALGGAGPIRIQWEFDDAVFQESAGKEFMLEAIDILKGVLGFEDRLPPSSRRQSHVRSEEVLSPTASAPIPARSSNNRPRSPSDPFLDTPALSRSVATSSSRSPAASPGKTLLRSTNDEQEGHHDDLPGASKPSHVSRGYTRKRESLDADQDSIEGEPRMRIWRMGELDNPELQALISLFPDFITRHPLPRFAIAAKIRRRVPDVEEGLDIAEQRKEVSCGTGRMWVGDEQRREGWRGSWWHRFIGWWRRLFC
ncbi:hypothetical protein BU17DRAFT_52722 [Hysterangium stoloniferum]|nr:hypothetical protein BU17DRAFT_52722 [Hysterangium stoloniferum]